MQFTQYPVKIPTPFADGGAKNPIPVASQISITPGAASFIDGFPPSTRTPIESGGTPPDGLDFNGLFNMITAAIRWQQAGAPVYFDQAFANAVGGYPKGTILSGLNNPGYLWVSTIENNTHNPDNNDFTGWIDIVLPAFPAVQQGGGIGQDPGHKIYLGWAAGGARLTVDFTDFGIIASEAWVDAGYLEKAGGTITGGLTVNQNFVTNGSVAVAGGANITGFVNIGQNLGVSGSLVVNQGATISGNLSLGAGITMAGNISMGGNLSANQVAGLTALVSRQQSNGAYLANYTAATLISEFINNGPVQIFPNGYIIQNFGGALPSGGASYFNYPQRFPNACFCCVGTIGASGDPQAALQVAPVPTDPGSCLARLTGGGGGNNGLNFLAVGY